MLNNPDFFSGVAQTIPLFRDTYRSTYDTYLANGYSPYDAYRYARATADVLTYDRIKSHIVANSIFTSYSACIRQ